MRSARHSDGVREAGRQGGRGRERESVREKIGGRQRDRLHGKA